MKKYTEKQIFKAFKEWNTEIELNPESFANDEDIKKMGIEACSKDQTQELIKRMNND